MSVLNEEFPSAFVRAIKKSNWNYVIEAISDSDKREEVSSGFRRV